MLYTKEAIEKIHYNQGYYIPENVLKNKIIRTEVKWGYIALVNVLLREPKYDDYPYVEKDNPLTIEMLKALANKNVDQAKIDQYIQELSDYDVVHVRDNKVFIEII